MTIRLYSRRARRGASPFPHFAHPSRNRRKLVARLFYPILLIATAAFAAALWAREGWPVEWLSAFGTPQAQAQSGDPPAPQVSQGRYPDRSPPARYPTTGQPSAAAGAGRYSVAKPAPQPGEAFHRPAAPPSGARLRIPAPGERPEENPAAPPGAPQPGGAPIPFESTKLLARVASEHILLGDVMADVYKEFAQQAKKYPAKDHQLLLQSLVYKHVQSLIPIKVLVAAARKKVPDDKWPEAMKQLSNIFDNQILPGMLKENKLASVEAFDAQLKAEGSSLEKFKLHFAETHLAQQFLADHTKVDEEVHPEELRAYYQAHYDEYKYAAKVRWEQLLVKFTNRDKQQARQKLAEMGNQVRSGAPWAAVAKARSEGITAAEGGAWDWTNQGSMKLKELDEALFHLPVGTMSRILEDERSWQIVRVVERKDAGVVSFEDKQKEIKKLIVDERIQAKKQEFLKATVESYKSQIWTVFERH